MFFAPDDVILTSCLHVCEIIGFAIENICESEVERTFNFDFVGMPIYSRTYPENFV